ncbi:cell division protein FtsX [Acetobacter sp.]|uniref:cell division protein FtsX n=1 Tax=Acetobacter sp. TaxID=440 RepID=UPI0039E8462D
MTRPFSGRKDGLSLSEALPDRSLFALVAMMGFLAALTLAGASGARALSARWSGGAAQLLTIQVPDANAPLGAQGGGSATTTRVQAVLADLASLPDGTEVHQLTPPELARLLEPWLGETDSSALPLPAIIRVKLPPDASVPATLEQALSTHVPGTIMEHNARWGERLRALANSLLACAGLALLSVGGIATMITGLATRTGLASRKDIIKTLHGLGASDSYIAGRFAWRTATLGFGGGLSGTLMACLPLLLLLQMAAPFASVPLTTPERLLPQNWQALANTIPSDMLCALALLPFVAAFICWFTTQVMVRLWLLRLP